MVKLMHDVNEHFKTVRRPKILLSNINY